MKAKSFVLRNPVISYFVLTLIISWFGAFAVIANRLIHGLAISRFDGLVMFPIMLLGPCLSAIMLTGLIGGKKAILGLFGRMKLKWRNRRWLLALLIPPASILLVLFVLSQTISMEYYPNLYVVGFAFGIPAGFLEEIGWMGFAFPHLIKNRSALSGGLILGLFWSVWHLPVINFLGTASPHGTDWFTYFLSFMLVMTAMRVIIAWVYSNTKSLLITQFMHISSTGFLVIFSPNPMATGHEPIWYACYGLVLWAIVVLLFFRYGKDLIHQTPSPAS
jgi:uncharacterized protein